MAANTAYLIQAFLIYTTTATATGSDLGASGPASPTRVNLQGFIANTAAAESNAVATAFGSIIANASGSTADRPSRIVGVVRNGANSGTFQLQTKVETGITGTAGHLLYIVAECTATVEDGLMMPGCTLDSAAIATGATLPANHTFTVASPTGDLHFAIGRWIAGGFLPSGIGSLLASGCIGNFSISRVEGFDIPT